MFVNYVDIIAKDIVDKRGRVIGRPYDFLVKLGGVYPLLTTIIVARGAFSKEYAPISWPHVRRVEENINLNLLEDNLVFNKEYDAGEYTSIKKSIMDQQVVDTFNRKVVRVNDVHLLKAGKDLRIAHVDVGFRSMVRRLGWEHSIDRLIKLFVPRSRYLTRENLISWKFVQPLEVQPKQGTLKLNVSQDDLTAIPPADLSEIMDELDAHERIALFRSFDFETQVDVLNEMDVELQKDLIEELDTQSAINLLEEMDPDEVADLLGALSKKEAGRILSLMSPAKARKLYTLLKYESDSAGGLMMTEFIRISKDMTVGEAISKIRGLELDTEMVYYAYVVDADGRMIGKVTFKQLLQGGPDDKIEDIMIKRIIKTSVDTDAKEVAYLMEKYDLLAVPVLDEGGVIKGIITIDDILAMVIDETWGEKPGLL